MRTAIEVKLSYAQFGASELIISTKIIRWLPMYFSFFYFSLKV